MAKIDHVAITTKDYDEYVTFFEEVFDMHSWREKGEAPKRQIWFREGIQINETPDDVDAEAENGVHHISIAVNKIERTMEKIKSYNTIPIDDHWFKLPNGVKIELKLLDDWKVGDDSEYRIC